MKGIHIRKIWVGLALGAVMLAGCGVAKVPDTIVETSLVIDRDGSVTSHFVGVFDKAYYDLNGLRKMAQEEVAAYNTAGQKGNDAPVVLDQVAEIPESGDSVIASYVFDSARTYENYTGNLLFYGTLGDALEDGFNLAGLGQRLYDVKGSDSIGSKELISAKMAGKHVVILAEGTRVYCPYKIAYLSETASVMEDGSVSTTGVLPEDYPVIIVLSK